MLHVERLLALRELRAIVMCGVWGWGGGLNGRRRARGAKLWSSLRGGGVRRLRVSNKERRTSQ